MSTQELLLEEIKRQPETVLLEVWHYLRFLTRQREEEAWTDVLPSRQVEQEVLDHLDSKCPGYVRASVDPHWAFVYDSCV